MTHRSGRRQLPVVCRSYGRRRRRSGHLEHSGNGDPTLILEDVDYGDYAFLDLPAAAYTLGFDADNDRCPIHIEIPALDAGAQYNVLPCWTEWTCS
jgi:hypothetical protein